MIICTSTRSTTAALIIAFVECQQKRRPGHISSEDEHRLINAAFYKYKLGHAKKKCGGAKELARAVGNGQVVQAGKGSDATYFFPKGAVCQQALGESSDSASSAGMQNDTGTIIPELRDPEAHAQVSLAENDITALAEHLSQLKTGSRRLKRAMSAAEHARMYIPRLQAAAEKAREMKIPGLQEKKRSR